MTGLFPFVGMTSLFSNLAFASALTSLSQVTQIDDATLNYDEVDSEQPETEDVDDQGMMDGWAKEDVETYVMENGFWFIICASIESAWEICEEKYNHGELDTFLVLDAE